ncbi:MAG: hypothetical protein PHT44_02740 [Candidatus Portnoybacteria bacterium]|nr:hypothetical protein [Candidatus Portnoybacteria bacterium]MDD4982458.1 hypothetical protein [Candidatus Portnoybacteria bacterium]
MAKKNKFSWLVAGMVFGGFLCAGNALAFDMGENKTFFVDTAYDLLGRTQVSATLLQVGDHALFYAANDWWSESGPVEKEDAGAAILNLAVEFDKTIYPRLTKVYGSEWSPGIDNDLRVVVLITKIRKGAGGYFNSFDEYPRAQIANSNEREILYLNSSYAASSSAKDFLAHEFQHMINFYQKEKLRNSVEDVWLNEARSEYASSLCGYDSPYSGSNLERRVKDFLRYPTDSLTEWQNEFSDYGAANLFMQYLVNRYGEQILTRMMKTEAVGIASIDQALADGGFSERFGDVFANWIIADYIDDCQIGEGQKYCYLSPLLPYERLHVSPQMSNLLSVREGMEFTFSDAIKDWAGRWYEILPQGSGLNLMVKIQGAGAANWQAALVIIENNGAKSVRPLSFDSARLAATIVERFGNQVVRVILILSSQTKNSNFSASDPARQFSYTVKTTADNQLPPFLISPLSPEPSVAPLPELRPANPNFPDGSLIRAKGEEKVFIIKGNYRRWLQTPQILSAYPHLGWQNVIEVAPEQLNFYQDAWLVRADGDARVYEINGDGTKHWLNMSAQQFADSGRSWNMVYIVNARERDLYKTGAEVLR